MEHFEVEDLEAYLSGLGRIFDNVRLVDPALNKVINKYIKKQEINGSTCYKYWDKNIQCKNCISRNVAREKNTFSKVEYNGEGIFLVIATAFIFKGEQLIVEMIKSINFIDEIYGEKSEVITDTADIMSNLNKKLITDALTKSYNRRYINKQLPEDIEDALNNKENLSIIMLDIDCFKNINDIHGHMAGDLALKNLTNIIKSNIRRKHDWVARYGGDEFIIVLKNAGDETCKKVIKNIQTSLKENPVKYKNDKIEITISLGAYVLKNKKRKFDEVLYSADKNLNIAKNNGKNKFVIS